MKSAVNSIARGSLTVEDCAVGEKSPLHSLTRKKAKEKRTPVLSPVFANYAARVGVKSPENESVAETNALGGAPGLLRRGGQMLPIISSCVANGILLEPPEADKVPAILCCSSHGLLYSDSAETRSRSVIA